ncbi:MAG: hypothetical protein KAS23_16950, partial [Anaerohalosphaera sp.]|nr:hypothetical protein [Anaerohalosphaera sp.]
NSPYLSSEERLEIVSCIEEVNSSVLADAELARKKEMEDVFAGSVDALKAGDKAKARAGFAEVAASNLDISRKGLTAADYIAKIDAPQPEPVVVIPEPVVVKVDEVTEVKIEAAPAVEVIAAPVENKPRTFNDEKERQRLVQISYTQAIITDAIKTANEHLAHNEFALAKQAIAKAFSVVNKNKILLGEELFRQNYGQLSLMNDQISDAEKTYQDAQEAEAAKAAKALQQSIREEVDMAREASIEEALDNAGIFVRQQKYDAAMGQVDKVLALDKNNNEALTLKYMLEDNMNWREQIETRRRADEAEIKAFHRADEAGIPNSDIITHPKNWKEIVERRKEEEMSGQNELDVEVNKQLDETVDLSSLTSDTTLEDAIEILVNAVEPPLQIIVLWTDLENNAFIQQDTAIGISGERLRSIPLRTGLERVIQGVSGGLTDLAYSLENGIITIATKETLPEKYEQRIYDVSELSSAPFQDRSGMGGGMGG